MFMQFPLASYGNIHRDYTRPCLWACRRAQYSYNSFSSLSPESSSAVMSDYLLMCMHYQKSGLTRSGHDGAYNSLQLCWTVAHLPNIGAYSRPASPFTLQYTLPADSSLPEVCYSKSDLDIS